MSAYHLDLGRLSITLSCDDGAVQQQWRELFGLPPRIQAERSKPDLRLQLKVVDTLPPLPAERPAFVDDRGILSVYNRSDGWLLHFHDGALVCVAPGESTLAGTITPLLIRNQRLEDVTYTSLAPLLRRKGYYLAHAFAASQNNRSILLVGPSGSGKTTTGLALLLAGWRILGNDVVLLEQRPEGVYALPTPGAIHVRRPTLTLLPELAEHLTLAYVAGRTVVKVDAETFSEPQPVRAIFHPQIAETNDAETKELNRAVSLARLLEESVDRWDEETLAPHMALLLALSEQATAYELLLGRNLSRLPALISA